MRSKLCCFLWVYPIIVGGVVNCHAPSRQDAKARKGDPPCFISALNSFVVKPQSRGPWRAGLRCIWALAFVGICFFAATGYSGERSGGAQQAGKVDAGNSSSQEQAAPVTADDFLKKGDEYARLHKWKEAE